MLSFKQYLREENETLEEIAANDNTPGKGFIEKIANDNKKKKIANDNQKAANDNEKKGMDEGQSHYNYDHESDPGKKATRLHSDLPSGKSFHYTTTHDGSKDHSSAQDAHQYLVSQGYKLSKAKHYDGHKGEINEIAPPGFEGTVKAMKKHKDISNPWALAWWQKNHGYKSHKK